MYMYILLFNFVSYSIVSYSTISYYIFDEISKISEDSMLDSINNFFFNFIALLT